MIWTGVLILVSQRDGIEIMKEKLIFFLLLHCLHLLKGIVRASPLLALIKA